MDNKTLLSLLKDACLKIEELKKEVMKCNIEKTLLLNENSILLSQIDELENEIF